MKFTRVVQGYTAHRRCQTNASTCSYVRCGARNPNLAISETWSLTAWQLFSIESVNFLLLCPLQKVNVSDHFQHTLEVFKEYYGRGTIKGLYVYFICLWYWNKTVDMQRRVWESPVQILCFSFVKSDGGLRVAHPGVQIFGRTMGQPVEDTVYFVVTNSMEHSPSLEAYSLLVGPKIVRLLSKPKVQYSVHWTLSWVSRVQSTLSHSNSFEIHFNIISPSMFWSPKWSLPFRFSDSNSVYICHVTMHPTSSTNLILHLITYHNNTWQRVQIMKLLNIEFCQYPVSSLLGTNILLSTMFSNTVILCPSLRLRDQVSHPCKATTFCSCFDASLPVSVHVTHKLCMTNKTAKKWSNKKNKYELLQNSQHKGVNCNASNSSGSSIGVKVILGTYWGGGIALLFLELGTWWRWVVNFMHCPFYCQGNSPSTHWIGGCWTPKLTGCTI
jgi:hypothetical protein